MGLFGLIRLRKKRQSWLRIRKDEEAREILGILIALVAVLLVVTIGRGLLN